MIYLRPIWKINFMENIDTKVIYLNMLLIMLAIITAVLVIVFGEKGAGSGLLMYLLITSIALKVLSLAILFIVEKLTMKKSVDSKSNPNNLFFLVSFIFRLLFTIILILGIAVAVKDSLVPYV